MKDEFFRCLFMALAVLVLAVPSAEFSRWIGIEPRPIGPKVLDQWAGIALGWYALHRAEKR